MRDRRGVTRILPLLLLAAVMAGPGCDGASGAASGARDGAITSTRKTPDAVTVITLEGSKRGASSDVKGARTANASTERPEADAKGDEEVSPQPAADEATTPRASAEVQTDPVDGGSVDAGAVRTDRPAEGADSGGGLVGSLQKLVRDLEFNAGLPEPVQQNVVAPPPPWTPPPEADSNPRPVIDAISPPAARSSGGAAITIRGRNLDAMQVLFGMSPAPIVTQGPELLVVQAPPGPPGDAPIVVTNRDGNYAVAAMAFRYVP